MKNICLGMTFRSIIHKIVALPPSAETKDTPLFIHDSVIVSTLVVKEHGERLLIKFQKAAPWLAECDKRNYTSRDIASIPYQYLLYTKVHASQFPFYV